MGCILLFESAGSGDITLNFDIKSYFTNVINLFIYLFVYLHFIYALFNLSLIIYCVGLFFFKKRLAFTIVFCKAH